MTTNRLNAVALGLALGVLWGVSIFIMGIIASYSFYGQAFVTAVGVLYIGYGPTLLGSFIGGLIGFVDAFIAGLILAWLYNAFSCWVCGKCSTENKV